MSVVSPIVVCQHWNKRTGRLSGGQIDPTFAEQTDEPEPFGLSEVRSQQRVQLNLGPGYPGRYADGELYRDNTMVTDKNPYQPPETVATSQIALSKGQSPLLPVAIGLLVPAILHVFGALFFFVYVFMISGSADADPESFHVLKVYCLFLGIATLYALLLASGAVSMLRQGSYMWAMTVCVLALFPFMGWCWLISLPFGIWGIVLLRRTDVRASFKKV